MTPRSELVVVDKNDKVILPEWAWKALLKRSGSKAKSNSGIRKVVRREFIKLLKDFAKEKKRMLSR